MAAKKAHGKAATSVGKADLLSSLGINSLSILLFFRARAMQHGANKDQLLVGLNEVSPHPPDKKLR